MSNNKTVGSNYFQVSMTTLLNKAAGQLAAYKEHEAQFLALCSLCAAMYKEFVKLDEDTMKDFGQALINLDELVMPIKLDYFSRKHDGKKIWKPKIRKC